VLSTPFHELAIDAVITVEEARADRATTVHEIAVGITVEAASKAHAGSEAHDEGAEAGEFA
jgi:hypothetical protein